MQHIVSLRRLEADIGEPQRESAELDLEPFGLYGRHHEVERAIAEVEVTRLVDGVYMDLNVRCRVDTTCDRTLEPTAIEVEFGDRELISGPDDPELYIEDWELDLKRYAQEILTSEIPLQVFAPETEPVEEEPEQEEVDPRWRGLDGLFAAGS